MGMGCPSRNKNKSDDQTAIIIAVSHWSKSQ